MTPQIEHRHVPVSLLTESHTNPRKRFDADALQDLADSITSQGLLQPITVRPHPRLTGYEVVFGHRRFRACQLAGMAEVPCIVRPMNDEQVLLAQVVENLARADVHPVEEAEAFRQLLDHHGKSADDIATEVGKSRTYVYNRLKLATLTPDARDECMRLGIGGEIATLIARVPPSLQAKAVARCWHKSYDGDITVLSYRDARRALEGGYTLFLEDAVWPIHDERLVPAAGPCTNCSKCSTNDPALLADLGAGICTDTECFRAKDAAHLQQRVDAARAAGTFRQVATWQGSGLERLAAMCWNGRSEGQWTTVTYTQGLDLLTAAGASFEPPVVYLVQIDGHDDLHECINQADATWIAALVKRSKQPAAEARDGDRGESGDTNHDEPAGAPEAQPLTPLEQAIHNDWPAIRTAVMRRTLTTPRTLADLQLVLLRELELAGGFGECETLMGWDAATAGLDYADSAKKRQRLLLSLGADHLGALLVMNAICEMPHQQNAEARADRLALCERYGIDPLNPAAEPATVERDLRVPDIFEGAEAT